VKAHTFTLEINRPRDEVYAFINKPDNLPKWADGFAKEVKTVDGHHKVVTPDGEMFLSFDSNPKLGVIDMWAGPTPDQMDVFPVRVIARPDGATVTTMTLFQTPDVDEATFGKQIESLTRETGNLKRMLENA
jgi:uncharacterized protein YndB with AHSA1/START domain